MSADVHSLAAMRDGWDAPPAHRTATAVKEATPPRLHRLRLLPLGDGYSARDGEACGERQYHPYGLMVWSGV